MLLTLLQLDALEKIPKKLGAQSGKRGSNDLIRDHWNFVQLEVDIGGLRRIQKRRYNAGHFRFGHRGMEQHIAPVLDETEADAKRTAIRDSGADRLVVWIATGQPDLAAAPTNRRAGNSGHLPAVHALLEVF